MHSVGYLCPLTSSYVYNCDYVANILVIKVMICECICNICVLVR